MENTISNDNYQPKFGRVLIEREVKQQVGLIHLTNDIAQRHAACKGKIVALGETAGWTETYDKDGERIPIQTLKIGDEVIFGRHSGAWLDATYDGGGKQKDDGKLFICQDADILCVINKAG